MWGGTVLRSICDVPDASGLLERTGIYVPNALIVLERSSSPSAEEAPDAKRAVFVRRVTQHRDTQVPSRDRLRENGAFMFKYYCDTFKSDSARSMCQGRVAVVRIGMTDG
jgi:hypothetical protein